MILLAGIYYPEGYIYIEIEQDRALKRVRDAEKFVERIEKYLQS